MIHTEAWFQSGKSTPPREAPRTLYVNRPLKNTEEFRAWAKAQGFEKCTEDSDLHVTILYSKVPVLWSKFSPDQQQLKVVGGSRTVAPLGDDGAVVLKFVSPDLKARHEEFRNGGGSHDYPSYLTHVTITYEAGDLDLKGVEPYRGPLIFGPEEFQVIDADWTPSES